MPEQQLNADLLTAAEKGDTAAVRALLAKGADVNCLGTGGATPLILAVLHAELDTIETLLANGADIEAKGAFMTPLMQAVSSRKSKVPVLLAHGADVNAKDSNGKTVLMWAVDTSFSHDPGSEMVRSLLDRGPDVNAKDNDGLTALILASMADKNNFNPAAIEALLTKGADVDAKDRRGQTPLMLVVATIAQKGTFPGHPSLAFAKVLIAHGADVNAKDNSGESVLKKAGRSDTLIARTLKRAGAKK